LVYLKQHDFVKAKADLFKAKMLGYTDEYDNEVERLIIIHFS